MAYSTFQYAANAEIKNKAQQTNLTSKYQNKNYVLSDKDLQHLATTFFITDSLSYFVIVAQGHLTAGMSAGNRC